MASLIAPAAIAGPSNSHSSLADTVRVPLAPTAGFCVKSVTTEPGFYTYVDGPSPSQSSSSKPSAPSSSSRNLLEPTRPTTRTLQIPVGMKVFLNVAWESRVPAPPEVGEDAVRRAMAGADLDLDLDEEGVGEYYVPVVVSEPREDLDKRGKPSIVFDCVFSASLKSRCLKDREFKLYLIELGLEHVEEKAHMTLSRQVGTPNIASKGKLEPRTVLMPRALIDPDFASSSNSKSKTPSTSQAIGGEKARASPLIQELPSGGEKENGLGNEKNGRANYDSGDKSLSSSGTQKKLKSILKSTAAANANTNASGSASAGTNVSSSPSASDSISTSAGGKTPLIQEIDSKDSFPASGPEQQRASDNANSLGLDLDLDVETLSGLPPLRWKWGKEGDKIRIEVDVPELTRELHAHSTLDIEPRRILLHIPQEHFLDINLELSDTQIGKMGTISAVDLDDRPENIKKSIADAIQVNGDGGSALLSVRGHNAGELLRLKRQRDFDVGNSHAEWRVGEKKLVISV